MMYLTEPDEDTSRKEYFGPISLMNRYEKILNNFSKSHTNIKKIVQEDQVGFIPKIQGWFNS